MTLVPNNISGDGLCDDGVADAISDSTARQDWEPDAGELIATYEYDAAVRRIEEAVAGQDRLDYFWNEQYQNIETRKGQNANPLEQWVYDIRYIDAPAVRFYDGNTDGDYIDAGDNTLYFVQDANFNVTAVVDASNGSVAERYVYTPYGTRTVIDASFANPTTTSSVANNRGFQGLLFDGELTITSPDSHGPQLS